MSIGITKMLFTQNTSSEEINVLCNETMGVADQALYQSKKLGGNTVTMIP